MSEDRRPTVLVVDDNDEIREMIRIGLGVYQPPFRVEFAACAEGACRMLSAGCYAALVVDVNLLGPTGVVVAAEAHEKCPGTPKVFFTAYDRGVTREHAALFGMEVWAKPMEVPTLFKNIERLIGQGRDALHGATTPLAVPPVLSEIAGPLLAAASAAGLVHR